MKINFTSVGIAITESVIILTRYTYCKERPFVLE
jgi:hypothetical protein